MKIAKAKLSSVSPYSQGRPIQSKKERTETHEAFEERVWRERWHRDGDGMAYIPPTQFKVAIAEAAKYNSIKIPGKGNATYTKHFESGILVNAPLPLGINVADIPGEEVFVPSNGIRGSGSRVWKTFGVIPEWSGTVEFLILDELIDKDVFTKHLEDAGSFIGVGRFRPRQMGYYGRFAVEDVVLE